MPAHKIIKSKTASLLIASLFMVGCGQPTSDSIKLTSNPLSPNSNFSSSVDQEYTDKNFVDVDVEKIRSDVAQIKLQMAAHFKMSLPNREELDVIFEDITIENSNVLATGHLSKNPDSRVNLIIQDDSLLLTVKSEIASENLELRPTELGSYILGTPAEDDHADCEVELHQDVDNNQFQIQIQSQVEVAAVGPAVIDILGVYTPAARIKEGGPAAMEALFKQAILETNLAMKNSKINAQVRLVGVRELSANESGNYSKDLAVLANRKGSAKDPTGKWDEVHAWREQLGADQVTLLGAYNGATSTLGLGYKQASDNKPAVASSAFTVTKTTAARRYFTVTHELGHNLGLDHDDGYASSSGHFQTIIRKLGSFSRILYFSNPDVSYKGYKTGTNNFNEAAIVARNVGIVSKFRAAKQ